MADSQDQIRQYRACPQEWNASYEEYAKSVGLSYTSLSLLSAIYGTEQCPQKLLSERCLLPKQTVNAVITAFYQKGWVRLEELPKDRRNKAIHLTDLGRGGGGAHPAKSPGERAPGHGGADGGGAGRAALRHEALRHRLQKRHEGAVRPFFSGSFRPKWDHIPF